MEHPEHGRAWSITRPPDPQRKWKLFGVLPAHGDFAPFLVVTAFVMGLRSGGDFLGWLILIGASVAIHELAQLVTLRALGVRAPFELGLRHSAGSRARGLLPWQAIAVALAGPLVNAAFALLVFELQPEHDLLVRFGMANAAMAMLHAVPVLPLDAGVAVRAIIDGATSGRGEPITQRLSLGLALLLVPVGLVFEATDVAIVGAAGALVAIVALRNERAEALLRADRETLAAAAAAMDADDLSKARELSARVFSVDHGPVQSRAEAAELAAWVELHAGDLRAARARLEAMPDTLWPSALLRATLRHVEGHSDGRAMLDDAFAQTASIDRMVPALVAFGRGDDAAELVTARPLEPEWLRGAAANLFRGRSYAASAVVSQSAFERTKLADHAYNAACALAQDKRPEEAVQWLTKAVAAGFANGELASTDVDLAPVRSEPAFVAVLASLSRTHPYRG
jgi:hypothetical protein